MPAPDREPPMSEGEMREWLKRKFAGQIFNRALAIAVWKGFWWGWRNRENA